MPCSILHTEATTSACSRSRLEVKVFETPVSIPIMRRVHSTRTDNTVGKLAITAIFGDYFPLGGREFWTRLNLCGGRKFSSPRILCLCLLVCGCTPERVRKLWTRLILWPKFSSPWGEVVTEDRCTSLPQPVLHSMLYHV